MLSLQTGILIIFFSPLHLLFLFILLEIALTFLYIEFFHLTVSFCVIPFLKPYIPTSWVVPGFFSLIMPFHIHSLSHTSCFVCLFICCVYLPSQAAKTTERREVCPAMYVIVQLVFQFQCAFFPSAGSLIP